MSLSSNYKTNHDKEVSGVRVVKGMTDDGQEIAFILARSGKANKRYTRALERLTKPHKRAIELETLNSEVADKLFLQAFVEGCVLGWENVSLADVTGIPADVGNAQFNAANAQMLFENLPDLYSELQSDASKAALFRDEALEATAKN